MRFHGSYITMCILHAKSRENLSRILVTIDAVTLLVGHAKRKLGLVIWARLFKVGLR